MPHFINDQQYLRILKQGLVETITEQTPPSTITHGDADKLFGWIARETVTRKANLVGMPDSRTNPLGTYYFGKTELDPKKFYAF